MRDLWQLIVRRSRTVWGVLITVLGLAAEHVAELQVITVGLGLPGWTKYVVQAFGLAMVIYARTSDARSGRNPA